MTESELPEAHTERPPRRVPYSLLIGGELLLMCGIVLGAVVGVGMFGARMAELSWQSIQRDAKLLEGDREQSMLYLTSVASVFAGSVRTDNIETGLRVSCSLLEGNLPRILALRSSEDELYQSANRNLEWLRAEGYCTE